MSFKLPGFLKTVSEAVFAGWESEEQEALRVSRKMAGLFSQFDDVGREEVAASWFGTTIRSKQDKTGMDHLDKLVSSGKENNLSIAAQVLQHHCVFMVACHHSDAENPAPHRWLAKMTQSESVFVRDVAHGLISDFELNDVGMIRDAMGNNQGQALPAFLDSRDPV